MKKYLKISNEIYPFKFHVLLGFKTMEDIKKVLKLKTFKDTNALRKYLEEIDWESSAGRTTEYKGNIIVLIKDFKGNPECYDTLHHELIHAINMSAEYIGIEFHKSTEEYFAYLTGFLTKKIYKELK
jgi:hypothetical protein